MSAESVVDRRPGAPEAQTVVLRLASPPPGSVAPAGPPPTVGALCKEFGPVCESAVDPLEIASALEFEGISDRIARRRYGADDVFALAQEMYFRVPRQPAEPEPVPDPWQVSKLRPALHGVLYGLPAVCFPAAGAVLAGPAALTVLVVSLLVAWALSQGLATIGYLRLGMTGDTAQTRRVLRAGLVAGLVLVSLAMTALGLVVHARLPVLMFGGGEGAYMLGACVLMVLGKEEWLPGALIPSVLGSTAFLVLGRPAGLEHVIWGELAASPVLTLLLAALFTRKSGGADGRLMVSSELRAAGPAILFGLLAAGLLTFPAVAGLHGNGGVNTGVLLVALPLSLSMGTAEWSLLWYRRRTRRLLKTNREPAQFGMKARLVLLAAVSQYVLGAVVLIAVVIAIAAATKLVPIGPTALVAAGAYLTLGTAMFLALTLQALRIRFVPLAAASVALAAELVFRHYGTVTQLAACLGLLVVIGTYATVVLGQAVRHAN